MQVMKSQRRRSGAATVESAIICSVTMLLLIGMLVGAAGVFRYQQVAAVAREAARWASVRGATYHQELSRPAATPEEVYENAIKPNLVGLDPNALTYTVTWQSGGTAPNDVTVTVTLKYKWMPEAYLFGPINLTSTSTMAVTY